MNFDLDLLQSAIDDAESVVHALQGARELVSEEDWEALPPAVLNVLDCACDLESTLGMDEEAEE